jgi:hypothetical protein
VQQHVTMMERTLLHITEPRHQHRDKNKGGNHNFIVGRSVEGQA